MTWAKLIERGEGTIEIRIVIEGESIELCTGGFAIGVRANGRRRVEGLLGDGPEDSERVRMAEGIPELNGYTASVIDVDEQITKAFSAYAETVAAITARVESTDTTINVTDSAAFTIGGFYHLNTEALKVVSLPSATTIEVERAVWDTHAQVHTPTVGARRVEPEITTAPAYRGGRRAWVYAHGATELGLEDEGKLIMRAILAEEPQLNEIHTWSIRVDPITALLDQPLGVLSDEEFQTIGIYYSWNGAFQAQITEWDGPHKDDDAIETSAVVRVHGFYASQSAFVAEINNQLASAGFVSTVFVTLHPEDGYRFGFTTDAADPRFVRVEVSSVVDGTTSAPVAEATGGFVGVVSGGETYRVLWLPPDPEETGVGSRWGGGRYESVSPALKLRTVPRACYHAPLHFPRFIPDEFDAGSPRYRAHLSHTEDLTIDDELNQYDPRTDSFFVAGRITAIDTSTGAVDVDGAIIEQAHDHETPQRFTAVRHYGSGPIDLAQFRDELVAYSTEAANRGQAFLTDDELADWTAPVTLAKSIYHFLREREYVFDAEVTLRDVLTHELRMHGLYMHTDADKKLALKAIGIPAPTETPDSVVGDDQRVSFGRIRTNPDGVLNVVSIRTGWDPTEAEHFGDTYEVRDVRSISRTRKRRVLEIAPLVRATRDLQSVDEARTLTDPIRTIFGGRYRVASLEVPKTLSEVPTGATLELSSPHLPLNGKRGFANQTGTLIGRHFRPRAASGQIEVLITEQNVAGYAPSGRVQSQSGSGTIWDLTLVTSYYSASGADVDHFAEDYRIEVWEWNSATPTRLAGKITSIVGDVVSVKFDASWSPGSSTWVLGFAPADDILANASAEAREAQFRYCFVANSSRVLVSDGAAARSLAP